MLPPVPPLQDVEQQIRARSLQTDLIDLLTRMDQMTISASSNVTTTALKNAESDHNVEDYGRDIPPRAIVSTALDGRNNETNCCICLEPYSEAHAAFEITACQHVVGKACLSSWLNCTSLNANTCPHCRKSLFSRPESLPSQLNTLEVFTQLWTRVKQTMAQLVELCEQRQERSGYQATVGRFLRDLLNEVKYEFFLSDVNYCLEYLEGSPPWVLLRSVSWHT